MGEFDKNPKLRDHFDQLSDTVIKTVFSFIPAGTIFDSFWSYRTNLKQKRVIDFSESMKKALEDINEEELHASNFETKDFVDLMEAVFMKVQNTQSELKLERYKNILVKQIIKPAVDYEVQSYLNLLNDLSDLEIIMLDLVETSNPRVMEDTFPIKLAWYNRESPIVDCGIQEKVHIRIGQSDVTITDAQIMFLEFGLINKVLIRRTLESNPIDDKSSATMENVSKKIAEYSETKFTEKFYELTLFGKSFLDYIRGI